MYVVPYVYNIILYVSIGYNDLGTNQIFKKNINE